VLINAAERRDGEGQHVFTRLTILNATDRRQYERDLLKARSEAEARLRDERSTSALREQFIAVLGHDLRNPLSAIVGGAQLLMRTPLNDRGQAMARLIEGSASRMSGLIDDVMDFARGRLWASFERVPPTEQSKPISQLPRRWIATPAALANSHRTCWATL
jgi:sigma-B regulation protein RsbU (phosphoserine phosphatase)